MFEVLLYADLNCTDAAEMLNRIEANKYMNSATKVELVEVIQKQHLIVHGTQTTKGTGLKIQLL